MPEPRSAPEHGYDDLWESAYGDLQEIGPVHRHMRRMLGEMLAELSYDSVLDVGCGAGHNLPVVCAGRAPERVTGVDVSSVAVERARRRSGADFRVLDIEREHLDESWDLCFCSLVLEHLPQDVEALANIRAMTGRHLVVTTIAGDMARYRPWEEQMGHVRNYRAGELEHKLRAAGFEPRRVVHWGWPFYSPIGRLLQNRMTAEPSFGPAARAAAALMHAVYRLNSSRRGDLLLVSADVAGA
jgi:SAM-dependent methyltransferase